MTVARSLNIAVALLLLPLLGGTGLREAWRYERTAVGAGQWWRLITCHFVHLDVTHAVLNAVGLALLWALFAREYRFRQWLLTMAVSAVSIAIGFWFFSTRLQWYVGASALLHGVFACGCAALIRKRERIGFIAGALFVAKLVFEQLHGPLPFERADQVVTISHLYGAMGGALAGLLLRPRA
jgi:rhomboid family GlyGly-CTERM serine protease